MHFIDIVANLPCTKIEKMQNKKVCGFMNQSREDRSLRTKHRSTTPVLSARLHLWCRQSLTGVGRRKNMADLNCFNVEKILIQTN